MDEKTKQALFEWTEERRKAVLRSLSYLTPEQLALFPEDVRRGDRPFTIQERWRLESFIHDLF